MSVIKDTTGTEVLVFSVSTAKSGTTLQRHACANKAQSGMETSAKSKSLVQEAESSTKSTKSVSVLTIKLGTVLSVLTNKSAAADNSGMTPVYNATAQTDLTGMERLAFSAQVVKYGILQQNHVSAQQAANGMAGSALLSKVVKEELSGIKTPGLATVHQELSGTTTTALPTHVLVVNSGIILPRLASVQESKSSSTTLASLLKQPVSVVKSGIEFTCSVNVLMANGSTEPTVSPSKNVSTTRYTIL